MNWTYRRTVAHVAEWSGLREVLGLETVLDHSTLAVFHHRKLSEKSGITIWLSLINLAYSAADTHGPDWRASIDDSDVLNSRQKMTRTAQAASALSPASSLWKLNPIAALTR